ncbi:MAG: filamentous hemagglutinin N-terminal domain-containing protein [Xenococcaceae cyanobacterium MO_188.B32]|nr:filamentous hemagglutinin N-terminal domain-containing protein [Xenococcaceae cyanobacterium MO_188.B32]
MIVNWQCRPWHFWIALYLALSGATEAGSGRSVLAQIIPDDTLGEESSRVMPLNGQADRIDGGAARGSNLFHSFREFNINEGRGAYFKNPTLIENIFSRVTGSKPSHLLGTLGVLGNANLFFLNPNGIIFGPNASLDIRGSFLATTADLILFPDGSQFSATNPQAAPLLTIDVPVPIGLQFEGEEPGELVNVGNLEVGQDLVLEAENLDLQGQLKAGRNLTLKAQDTVWLKDSVPQPFTAEAGGELLVQGGRAINLSGLNNPNSELVTGRDMVFRSPNRSLSSNAVYTMGGIFRTEQLDGHVVDFIIPHDQVIKANGDVTLEAYSGASLYILAGGSVTFGGDVTITDSQQASIPKEFTTVDGTTISVRSSNQPTLDVRAGIDWQQLPGGLPGNTASNNLTPKFANSTTRANITVSKFDNQQNKGININAGSIYLNKVKIDTGNDFEIDETSVDNTVVQPRNIQSGNINLNATGDITITNNSEIIAGTSGIGKGGDITVKASSVNITDGSFIDTGTFSAGNAGSITIDVTNGGAFNLLSKSELNTSTGDEGKAGDITVNAIGGDITITNNSSIGAATFGKAKGGDIGLSSDSMNIHESLITTFAAFEGLNAGSININVNNLKIIDSLIFATNELELGTAGNVTVNATEFLQISGGGLPGFEIRGGLSVQSERGPAGNLTVKAGQMIISDESQVSVSSLQGQAGNLKITANSLSLDRGLISSETAKSEKEEGANITLQISDWLTLSNESLISARASGQANGGNLEILNANGFIIVFPSEGLNGSDIIANAPQGRGGTIEIKTQDLFGIAEREDLTRLNDINASGGIASGIIEIDTSRIDPTRGLLTLPEEAITTEISQGCQTVRGKEAVEYFDVGRGGSPPTPDEPLNADAVLEDWIDLEPKSENDSNSGTTIHFPDAVKTQLVSPCPAQ